MEEFLKYANYYPADDGGRRKLEDVTDKDIQRWEMYKNGEVFVSGVNNNSLHALERKGYIKIIEERSMKKGADKTWTCDKIKISEEYLV